MKPVCLALLLALATPCAALAEDLSAVMRPAEIPMGGNAATRQTILALDDSSLEFVADPAKERKLFATDTETLEQQLRLVYRRQLSPGWIATYEAGAGAQRRDFYNAPLNAPALQESLIQSQSGGLTWKIAEPLSISGGLRKSATVSNEQAGTTESSRYSAEAALTPFKQTALKAGFSQGETLGADGLILFEDQYSSVLDQELPFVPVTLHASRTVSSHSSQLGGTLSETDLTDASLVWKPESRLTISSGIQTTALALSEGTQNYFTQFQLQLAEPVGFSIGAASVTINDPVTLTRQEHVDLSLGLKMKVSRQFDAGFSVKYPLLQTAAPYFSLSATAAF